MQSLILFLGVYFTYFRFFDRLNFRLSPHGGKFLGDHRRGVPPVPIPNTAVKPSAANGSWTLGPARVGRCQVYSPDLRKKVRASFLLIPVASEHSRNSVAGHEDREITMTAASALTAPQGRRSEFIPSLFLRLQFWPASRLRV